MWRSWVNSICDIIGAVHHASYDYIVVGAGSAGCVVASRLSQNPGLRVLLLEAGGSCDHPAVHDPTQWPTLFSGPLDWGYVTVPQRHAAGRVVPCPRGKMVGGCHSHNANAWVHGHPTDYDNWAYQGNAGWDFESVLPWLRKSEHFSGGASRYRGAGGPVHVELPRNPNPIAAAFIEAARETGIPVIEDNNAGQMEGASYFNLTIKNGKRNSVVQAYLDPARGRPNLTCLTEAETTRLLLGNGRCRGVEFTRAGAIETVTAEREVIVCAGVIGSPRLLLLSGLGPAADLTRFGIPVVIDLPGVGANLQDHVLLAGLNYEVRGDLPPLSNNGAESTLWWRSDSRLFGPDLQPVIIEFPLATAELASQVPPNCYAIAPSLVRPASRGRVTLTSADPAAPPAIDMNYLACDADVRALLICLELCREIGAASAFAPLRKREVLPNTRDKAKLIEFIRLSAFTFFHPTSTCKMGLDAMAVVDPRLRVHGVEGLRVADASIMPTVTTGNTNAPSVMIAEKLVQMLIDDLSPAITQRCENLRFDKTAAEQPLFGPGRGE
ncbi:MAG: GMC family oxidoreductase N-terminal domain-containing protein [Cyanobacteria bacterium]|nr:GMC family oxidoreductase N-terminal domain-containing protein [Cyanobacteriota bacterium]